jgi:hypothetical protein
MNLKAVKTRVEKEAEGPREKVSFALYIDFS